MKDYSNKQARRRRTGPSVAVGAGLGLFLGISAVVGTVLIGRRFVVIMIATFMPALFGATILWIMITTLRRRKREALHDAPRKPKPLHSKASVSLPQKAEPRKN